jgi:hypothetical protein
LLSRVNTLHGDDEIEFLSEQDVNLLTDNEVLVENSQFAESQPRQGLSCALKLNESKANSIILALEGGSSFNEQALSLDSSACLFPHSIVAGIASEVLMLERDDFLRIMKLYPEEHLRFQQTLKPFLDPSYLPLAPSPNQLSSDKDKEPLDAFKYSVGTVHRFQRVEELLSHPNYVPLRRRRYLEVQERNKGVSSIRSVRPSSQLISHRKRKCGPLASLRTFICSPWTASHDVLWRLKWEMSAAFFTLMTILFTPGMIAFSFSSNPDKYTYNASSADFVLAFSSPNSTMYQPNLSDSRVMSSSTFFAITGVFFAIDVFFLFDLFFRIRRFRPSPEDFKRNQQLKLRQQVQKSMANKSSVQRVHPEFNDKEASNSRKITKVRGKSLDISRLFGNHPGGDKVLKNSVGKDATTLFDDAQHSQAAWEKLNKLVVDESAPSPKMRRLFREVIYVCSGDLAH